MALEIKVEITNTKDKLIIADVTGNYNGVTNPGGWGSPNPAYSDITALSLNVFYPGSSVADLSAFNLYTTSYYTTTDRAYDLTSNVTLQDGVWKFEYSYTVTGIVGAVTSTIYSLRDIDLKCKIGQLALGDMETNNFDEIKSMYDRMVQAFLCEEYIFAQELYEEISDMLTDCSPYSYNCNC